MSNFWDKYFLYWILTKLKGFLLSTLNLTLQDSTKLSNLLVFSAFLKFWPLFFLFLLYLACDISFSPQFHCRSCTGGKNVRRLQLSSYHLLSTWPFNDEGPPGSIRAFSILSSLPRQFHSFAKVNYHLSIRWPKIYEYSPDISFNCRILYVAIGLVITI